MSRPTSELGGLGEKMDEPADIVRQNSTDLKEENDNRNCTAVVSSDVIYTSTRSIKQNSPIFCLPGELILYIVLIAVDEVSMERQSGGGENPPEIHCERVSYRQLQVTTRMAHVCSLWRHVCVQATTLWNTIDLLWPSNAIELFTSRVRYTPLRLILSPVLDYESATHLMTLDSSTFWNGQIAFWTDFITQNMHRVKSLEITMIIDDLEDNFHDFWDSIRPLKAPMLEKFSIRVAPYMSCVRVSNLFSQDAPRLEDILLDGFIFQEFDIGSFHTLVRLSIQVDGSEFVAHFRLLTTALSCTPNLESLRVDVLQLPNWTPMGPPDKPTVSLLKCIELSLEGFSLDMACMAFIFSSISFPSLRILTLDIDIPWHTGPDAITKLYSYIPQSVKQSCSMHETMKMSFRTHFLIIEASSGDTCGLRICHNIPNLPRLEDQHACVKELCTASFRIFNLHPALLSFNTAFFHMPITRDELLTKDVWCAILSHASSLRVLDVRGVFSCATWLDALDDPRMFCDSLHSLIGIPAYEKLETFDMMVERRRARGLNKIALFATRSELLMAQLPTV